VSTNDRSLRSDPDVANQFREKVHVLGTKNKLALIGTSANHRNWYMRVPKGLMPSIERERSTTWLTQFEVGGVMGVDPARENGRDTLPPYCFLNVDNFNASDKERSGECLVACIFFMNDLKFAQVLVPTHDRLMIAHLAWIQINSERRNK
jgi:hypothetical protein